MSDVSSSKAGSWSLSLNPLPQLTLGGAPSAPTPGTHSPKLSASLEQGGPPCCTVPQDRWLRHMTCDSAHRSHAPTAAAPALRADDGGSKTGSQVVCDPAPRPGGRVGPPGGQSRNA
ncbi:hypothetical protein GCM10010431_79210 [Streptomyces kunmingensis]